MHYYRRWSFSHWLGVSLLLHALVVLPFIGMRPGPHEDRRGKLMIELYGMVSNRQVEEKRKGGVAPRRVMPAIRHLARKTAPDHHKTAAPASPVATAKADEGPVDQAGRSSTVFLPAASVGNGDADQRQQSIGQGDRDEGALGEYLAKVAKRVQANLVYPGEVRKDGIEGVSRIAFTITPSGEIRGSSLRVQKSSGYPALDANALTSARMSAPFDKPPKELNVSIAVSFSIETLRSRTTRASAR